MTNIGRRCAMGCETWPDETEYLSCPICREPTKRYRGVDPMPGKEAKSAKNHGDFEHYYTTIHMPDERPFTDEDLEDMGITINHPQDMA